MQLPELAPTLRRVCGVAVTPRAALDWEQCTGTTGPLTLAWARSGWAQPSAILRGAYTEPEPEPEPEREPEPEAEPAATMGDHAWKSCVQS